VNSRIRGSSAVVLKNARTGVMKLRVKRPSAQLATDEIERLDAIGAIVNLRNADVADILFHAVRADVAVPAHHLHANVRAFRAEIAEQGLRDRRHQRQEFLGLALDMLVPVALAQVERLRDLLSQRTHAFDVRAHREQHPSNIRMHDDRIRRSVGARSGESARPCRRSRA
jgi:hypothetical protein